MRSRYPARNLCRAERAEGRRAGGKEGDPRWRAALRPGLRAAGCAAGSARRGLRRSRSGGGGRRRSRRSRAGRGHGRRLSPRPRASRSRPAAHRGRRGRARSGALTPSAGLGSEGEKRFESVKTALGGTGRESPLGAGLGGGGGGAAGSRCSGPSRCVCPAPPRPPALGEFKGARGASGHVGGAVQTWRGRGATLGGLLPPAARRSARGARRVGRGVRPRENRTPWRPLNARAAAAAPGCRGGSSPAPRPAGRGGASEPRNGPRSAGPAAAFAKRDKAPRRRPRRPPPGWALLSPPVRRRRAAGLSAIRGGRSGGCLFVRSACWLPPVTRGDAQFPELSGSGRRDRHRHERESPPLARPGPPVSSRRGRGRRRRRSDGDGARSGVAAAGQQV